MSKHDRQRASCHIRPVRASSRNKLDLKCILKIACNFKGTESAFVFTWQLQLANRLVMTLSGNYVRNLIFLPIDHSVAAASANQTKNTREKNKVCFDWNPGVFRETKLSLWYKKKKPTVSFDCCSRRGWFVCCAWQARVLLLVACECFKRLSVGIVSEGIGGQLAVPGVRVAEQPAANVFVRQEAKALRAPRRAPRVLEDQVFAFV